MQYLVVLEVVQQRVRHAVQGAGQEHRGALHPRRRVGFQVFDEAVQRQRLVAQAGEQQLAALLPGAHQREDHHAQHQRQPAAVGHFVDVGAKEAQIYGGEHQGNAQRQRQGPAPVDPGHHEEQASGDQHGAGDGDAVGGGQAGRGFEGQHHHHHRDQQSPVDEGHVDLADLFFRGVLHLQPRAVAQLDGLAGQRVGARNHRLRRDHRGQRRHDDQGQQRPIRRQQEEGVFDGGRVLHQQRALTEIIQRQARQHQAEPGAADRRAAEMAHVGV